jgi:hypothetical protein
VYLPYRDQIFGKQTGVEDKIFNPSRNKKAEKFIDITTTD